MLRIVYSTILASVLTSILTSSVVVAQQFKVDKVKGNKAVIEFSGTNLSPGRTYGVAGASSEGGSRGIAGGRKHVVGGSFDLQFLTYSSSVLAGADSKRNLIELLGRYGWNLETYEMGMIAGYTNSDTASATYSSIKAGAFYDYNMTPNRPGQISIYGASAEGSYTSITSGSGGSLLGFYVSGFAKWFVFGPSTALRVDAGYSYDKGTYTSYSTTTQGFAVRGGLSTYF